MSNFPACPKCQSEYTYEDGDNYVCPECAHEWPKQAAEAAAEAWWLLGLLPQGGSQAELLILGCAED